MELKEYIRIVKKNIRLWLLTITGTIILAFSYFLLLVPSYGANVAVNITRTGSQSTQDYKYDDYYRLQADEKFAETVSEWLKNPRVITDIYNEAGLDVADSSLRELQKTMRPEKLSPQLVAVNYSAASEEVAGKITQAMAKTLSRNTEQLNIDQNEENWFKIIVQNPVVRKNAFDPLIVFTAAFVFGAFLGFWVIMIKHYWN